MDHMGPYECTSEKERGKRKLIIVAIDAFTKHVEARVVDAADTFSTIKFLKEQIYYKHGSVEKILTDNGSAFTSSDFLDFCSIFGTKVYHSTPFYARGNGRAESAVKSIKNFLIKLISDERFSHWEENVQLAVYGGHNTTVNKATGHTPFYLMHARHALSPLDVSLELPRFNNSAKNYNQYVYELEKNYQCARQSALACNQVNKTEYKRYHDKKLSRPIKFEVGDQVLIRDAEIGGLKQKYSGPYQITCV